MEIDGLVQSENGCHTGSFIFHSRDGYLYHYNQSKMYRAGSGTVYFRCRQRTATGCRGTARVHFSQDRVVWENGQRHEDCRPNLAEVLHLRLRHDLRNACINEPWSAHREILARVVTIYPPQIAAQQTYDRVRESMRRNVMQRYPPLPATFEELEPILQDVNHDFVHTIDRQDFIYRGAAGPPDEKSYIFVSRRMGRKLQKSHVVFSDGTFGSIPQSPPSSQIFQISTIDHNYCVIPLVQVIMKRRTRSAYVHVLRFLQRLFPQFRPVLVMCDFEGAQQRAWREVFLCHVAGCYFHYSKDVTLYARHLGLSSIQPPNFGPVASIVRSCCALALLPPHLILRGFVSLAREAQRNDILPYLEEFFLYVYNTWLKSWRFESLSVFGLKWRTNNCAESANRILTRLVGQRHPRFWKLIEALRLYEHRNYIALVASEEGTQYKHQRKASAVNNDRVIKNLTQNLLRGQISINRFLHSASTRIFAVFIQNYGF